MADVVDEYGNPVQMTDEQGNLVQLTDELGNPIHLAGVAVGADMVAAETKVEIEVAEPPLAAYKHAARHGGAEGECKQEKVEQSSSSVSSEEDDGHCGRMKKKKALKEKIKEKLGVGKHKDKEEHVTHMTTVTVTSETRPDEHHRHQHEKKRVMEKIKEKLPGHY